METEIIYKLSKQDLKEAMSETISTEIEERVYSRFSNRLVSSNTVCEVLGISKTTLSNYIKEGRISPIDINAKYFKYELSGILKLDIKKFARVSSLKRTRS